VDPAAKTDGDGPAVAGSTDNLLVHQILGSGDINACLKLVEQQFRFLERGLIKDRGLKLSAERKESQRQRKAEEKAERRAAAAQVCTANLGMYYGASGS
jgi:hypothetical protein